MQVKNICVLTRGGGGRGNCPLFNHPHWRHRELLVSGFDSLSSGPVSNPCGHSKNCIFFVSANKNLAPSLATHQSFSPQCAAFPCQISLVRSPQFKHCCHHFEQFSAARQHFPDVSPPRDFVQLASEEPFKYHSGLWLLFSHYFEPKVFQTTN